MNTKNLDFTGNIHFSREIFIVFHIIHTDFCGKCGKLIFVQSIQFLKNQVFFRKFFKNFSEIEIFFIERAKSYSLRYMTRLDILAFIKVCDSTRQPQYLVIAARTHTERVERRL